MTHCSGCGAVLGWKKYRFQRMWRIPGYYCKGCMLELGREFDEHARITLPARRCDLCGVEYYFLRQYRAGGRHRSYCRVCHEAASSGAVPVAEEAAGQGRSLPPRPKKLPLVMMVFAGLGAFMMLAGLLFTMASTGEDASLLNIMFGAVTTALGFVLVRRTLRSRSMLMGRGAPPPPAR